MGYLRSCGVILLIVSLAFSGPIEKAVKLFEEKYTSYFYVMKVNYDESEDIDMIIRYYYKKPGFVRMEMIKPFEGVVLTYDPIVKKAFLRPFKRLKNFVLELDPSNRLIRGPSDHRVDESDILTLLRTVLKLKENGLETVREEGKYIVVEVKGKNNYVVRKNIAKFLLKLYKDSLFPAYAASFDSDGELIEEVFFENIVINPKLKLELFRIKK